MRRRISSARCHIGALRNGPAPKPEKPRWIRPIFLTPQAASRSTAPHHKSTSPFTGFFTNTGLSVPRNDSATSCIENGLAAVRAPIQRISRSNGAALSTCLAFATSVAIGRPVNSRAFVSQGNASTPAPSNEPGLVRGFHTPARNTSTLPVAARP